MFEHVHSLALAVAGVASGRLLVAGPRSGGLLVWDLDAVPQQSTAESTLADHADDDYGSEGVDIKGEEGKVAWFD